MINIFHNSLLLVFVTPVPKHCRYFTSPCYNKCRFTRKRSPDKTLVQHRFSCTVLFFSIPLHHIQSFFPSSHESIRGNFCVLFHQVFFPPYHVGPVSFLFHRNRIGYLCCGCFRRFFPTRGYYAGLFLFMKTGPSWRSGDDLSKMNRSKRSRIFARICCLGV